MIRILDLLKNWLQTLRWPKLLLLSATLFLIDVAIPDVLPFIDELILLCVTVLFANLRKSKSNQLSNQKNS